jgi:hypothetical protein
MLALSVVPAGGDADLTAFPCSRSPSPALFAVSPLRRSPNAARSLLRNPPVRSRTCGTSSGRRLMAPASLHHNHEAAPGNPELWPDTPDTRAGDRRRRLIPGRHQCPTATPTTGRGRLGQRRLTTRHRLLPRSRSNLQHHPDGTRSMLVSASARSCAAGRAEFAPVRPIAGGSGGRSQRSLPS